MIGLVIGVDPGPMPGIVVLTPARGQLLVADVVQCTARVAPGLLATLLQAAMGDALVQTEQFIIGRRSSRSSSAHDGAVTRELIGRIQRTCETSPVKTAVVLRNASQVKAWATGTRLEAAGLLEACKGMRHSRDAARHALYAAVHDGAIPDPLSKAWQR